MPHEKNVKKLILDNSFGLFLSKGIANTKIIDIAKAAKINRSLIYYYYKDINEIFIDIITMVLGDLKKTTFEFIEKPHSSTLALLKNYIFAPFYWAQTKPNHWQMWLYFYYLCSSIDEFQLMNTEIRQNGRARIESMIYMGIGKKEFQFDDHFDVSRAAFSIQGLITGNLVLGFTERGLDFKVVAEDTYQTVQRYLLAFQSNI